MEKLALNTARHCRNEILSLVHRSIVSCLHAFTYAFTYLRDVLVP